MKSCPICSFAKVGTALRCPNCQSALSLWINFDTYAKEVYRAGLHKLSQGDRSAAAELITQAVVLAPDEAVYAGALGRVLGQLGRYREAAFVLEQAHQRSPSPDLEAAWKKAVALAEAPPIPMARVEISPRPPVEPEPVAAAAAGAAVPMPDPNTDVNLGS
jgi:tetratricopeptide (TPR) repeat protein